MVRAVDDRPKGRHVAGEGPASQAGPQGSDASARAHLEFAALKRAFWERLASPVAQERFGGDAGLQLEHDPACARHRFAVLDGLDVLDELGRMAGLEGSLADVEDVGVLVERARRGSVLSVGELAPVSVSLEVMAGLGRRLSLDEASLVALDEPPGDGDNGRRSAVQVALDALAPLTRMEGLADLSRTLSTSIAFDGGEPALSDAASPGLRRARAAARDVRDRLIKQARRAIHAAGNALQDDYFTEREGRVVLPVRADGFARRGGEGKVGGIIHGSSGSGQTLFVEPHDFVDDNNALREAQMAVRREERRILEQLSRRVGEVADALLERLEVVIALDEAWARRRLGRDMEAVSPDVVPCDPDPATPMVLPQARHPILVLAGVEVVPNDLEIRPGQGVIVSGPNAGGKTVALKTVGLAVLMAQAGLRLPTGAPATLPLFRHVVTDVGDDQSIERNLSTFTAHLTHVDEATRLAEEDPRGTIVLLDEVAAGTDPEQGAALAEAVVRYLVDAGVTLMVTTHYERLKLLAPAEPERFVNAAVGFDLEAMRPTFRLRLGVPGSSSAIAVATRLGLPAALLDRARELLRDDHGRVDDLLRDIEATREKLVADEAALERDRLRVQERLTALESKERELLGRARQRKEKAYDAATDELRALERAIRTRRKVVGKVDDVAREAREVERGARDALSQHREQSASPAGGPPAELVVGARVHVPSFGDDGEIVAVKGKKVVVQLALARVTVEASALRGVAKHGGKGKKGSKGDKGQAGRWGAKSRDEGARRHFGADAIPLDPSPDAIFDLKGLRADEVPVAVEVSLDRAMQRDQDLVVLQHGHGSGALRRMIREHLARLGHVQRHRGGLREEGGDAVTVVWIRG